MVRRLTRGTIPIVATALPAVALALISAGILAGAAFDSDILWSEERVNMSEAAAARDPAVVARLLRRGENPNEPRPVRAGFVTNRRVVLTPIEAAIAARRPEVVDVLLPDQRPLDAPAWNRLRCLAEHAGDADTSALLDGWKPAGGTMDCAGVAIPW